MLQLLMSSAASLLARKQSGDKWSCKYPSGGKRGASRAWLGGDWRVYPRVQGGQDTSSNGAGYQKALLFLFLSL